MKFGIHIGPISIHLYNLFLDFCQVVFFNNSIVNARNAIKRNSLEFKARRIKFFVNHIKYTKELLKLQGCK
jgi:hypothetical protein